jgi:excisionase family DNA binding protein
MANDEQVLETRVAHLEATVRELTERVAMAGGVMGSAPSLPSRQSGLEPANRVTVSAASQRATLSIAEAAKSLGVSRTYAYQLARAGQIPTFKLGGRIVVPVRKLEELVNAEAEPAVGALTQ